MTVEECKHRCEELIEQGYGESEIIYYKDYYEYHPSLNIFTPDQYYPESTFFDKEFPNTSKEFVLIDTEDED